MEIEVQILHFVNGVLLSNLLFLLVPVTVDKLRLNHLWTYVLFNNDELIYLCLKLEEIILMLSPYYMLPLV